jgi:hypothetical protein
MKRREFITLVGGVTALLVGVGLMALLFYSSRAGYDNPPTIESDHPDDQSQA